MQYQKFKTLLIIFKILKRYPTSNKYFCTKSHKKPQMHKIKYGFALLYIIFCCKVSAQKTEIYQYQNLEYDQAVSLYNQSQFLSSQLIFEKLK